VKRCDTKAHDDAALGRLADWRRFGLLKFGTFWFLGFIRLSEFKYGIGFAQKIHVLELPNLMCLFVCNCKLPIVTNLATDLSHNKATTQLQNWTAVLEILIGSFLEV